LEIAKVENSVKITIFNIYWLTRMIMSHCCTLYNQDFCLRLWEKNVIESYHFKPVQSQARALFCSFTDRLKDYAWWMIKFFWGIPPSWLIDRTLYSRSQLHPLSTAGVLPGRRSARPVRSIYRRKILSKIIVYIWHFGIYSKKRR